MSRNYMNSEAFRDQVSRDLRSDAEFERRQRENRLTAAAPVTHTPGLIAAAPDLLSAARFALNYLEDHASETSEGDYDVEYAASCDAAVEGLRAAITKTERLTTNHNRGDTK